MQVAIITQTGQQVEVVAVNGGWTTIHTLDADTREMKVRNGQLSGHTTLSDQTAQIAMNKAEKARAARIEQQIEDTELPAEYDDTTKARYAGPMLALRAAARSYVKPANGNPCCGDRLAETCGAYTREVVVQGLIAALGLPGNPYLHLNPGQQSMNLRNKARQALKSGAVTIEQIETALNVAYITSPEFKATQDRLAA